MKGLQNGMVMQRGGDNTCDIYIECEQAPARAEYEGASSGTITALPCGSGRWRLTGLPAGGPYTVRIDGQVFTDIHVGDVWLLGGQSNMQGYGWMSEADRAFPGDPAVRVFAMTDDWEIARHPLHKLELAVDKVHTVLGNVGIPAYCAVGPGLAFALAMKEYTGVPQGVIACAHGGTSMDQWSPELRHLGGEGSLYGAMLRRFFACGGHVRGLFWYQGCNETDPAICAAFTGKMEAFVRACRADFGEELPIVQVQIGRLVDPADAESWTSVREQQRVLSERIPRLRTVAALTRSLDDGIHLRGDAQAELGAEAAEAMYELLYGGDRHECLPPPRYGGFTVRSDSVTGQAVVEVQYSDLHGGLSAGSRPEGFRITAADGSPCGFSLFDVQLRGDAALLRVAAPPEALAGCRLYYGYGVDPYANITDERGRAIPAMGPVVL